MSKKTFGLSVLTPRLAAKLMPEAKKLSRFQGLEKLMEKKGVDPVIQKNVIDWHKARRSRPMPDPTAIIPLPTDPRDLPSDMWPRNSDEYLHGRKPDKIPTLEAQEEKLAA